MESTNGAAGGTADGGPAVGGPADGGPAAGGPVGRPGQVRLARWRVLGVLTRSGLLVAVFALAQLVMRHLLGSPGPGPDPDIGAGMIVLAVVVLTAALGALRDAWRYGFRRGAVDWALAIAVLAVLGGGDVLRSWLADRAAGVGGELATGAVALVGPLVALTCVAGTAIAVTLVGAALGQALQLRRGAGPAGPHPAGPHPAGPHPAA